MKTFIFIIVLTLSLAAFAQQGDLTGFAGRVNAVQYGSWAMPIFYGTPAGAGAIIVGGNGRVTLPDGVEFVPFKVGTPIRINDGPNTETVAPTAIGNCGNGKLQNTCTITAVFTKAHGGGATCTVTSGTAGLQEAINALLSSAGLVVISGSWNGTTSMITTTATGSTAVGVEDLRVGIPSYYAWGGSHYTLSAGSGNPVVLNPAGDQTILNGFSLIVDAGGVIEAANSSSTTATLGQFMLSNSQGRLAYFNPTTGNNTSLRFNPGGSITLNPVGGADDGAQGVVINNAGIYVAGAFSDGVSLNLTTGSVLVQGGGVASGNPVVTFGSSGVEGVFRFFPQLNGGSYTIRALNTALTNVINWPNGSGTMPLVATTLAPSSSVCTDINSLLTTVSCGSTLFSAIGPGTSISTAMLVGNGSTIAPTGTGNITANIFGGIVDASQYAGANWGAKVNAAVAANPTATIIVPDSISSPSASSVTVALSNTNTLIFTGHATFGFCRITLGTVSKIYSYGAVLQMDSGGSGCSGVTHPQTSFISLQTNDNPSLVGVRVDCNSQASSTGFTFLGSSTKDHGEDLSVTGCTTGMLYEDQFGHFSHLKMWNNQVNLKMYSPGNGGGVSSNTFYDLMTVNPGSGVNVLMAIIAPSGSAGMGDNFFINHQCQNGTFACVAMVGTTTNGMDATWIGADPEVNGINGGSASTVTIDGFVIPESGAWYANAAQIRLESIDESDATTQPGMLLVNHSHLDVVNSNGFGAQFTQSIVTDSTSYVSLQGTYQMAGTVQQVSNFPDSIIETYNGAIAGVPVSRLDSAVPNAYKGNSLVPPFSSTTGTSSNAIATDTTYGAVNTVTFAASVGSTSTNRIVIANAIPSQGSNSDFMASILVKASADTNVQIGGSFGGTFIGFWFAPGVLSPGNNTTLQLYAGQWTRVLMWAPNIGAGTPLNLQAFPNDSAGATLSFTRLETLAYPTIINRGIASYPNAAARTQILRDGAVNPNNGNCSAVGTAASPSVASCGNASQGNFSCDPAATGATCQVNTTRVTANSQIYVQEDETQGTKLGVTCNTGTTVIPTSRLLASKVAGASFTINLGTVTTNPGCFSYKIDN